jgi:hypothetical protein
LKEITIIAHRKEIKIDRITDCMSSKGNWEWTKLK